MSVQIYTRTACAPCRTVKTWLQKKGVKYDEIDVDEYPEAAREVFDRTGFMMVPMTMVGDRSVSGMNFGLLTQLLNESA